VVHTDKKALTPVDPPVGGFDGQCKKTQSIIAAGEERSHLHESFAKTKSLKQQMAAATGAWKIAGLLIFVLVPEFGRYTISLFRAVF